MLIAQPVPLMLWTRSVEAKSKDKLPLDFLNNKDHRVQLKRNRCFDEAFRNSPAS